MFISMWANQPKSYLFIHGKNLLIPVTIWFTKTQCKFILHKAYDHEGNWEAIFEKGKPCTNENQVERKHIVSI